MAKKINLDKKLNETWNQFLIRKFRENGEPHFTTFLDKFFAIPGYTETYREGLDEEKSPKKEESFSPKKKVYSSSSKMKEKLSTVSGEGFLF